MAKKPSPLEDNIKQLEIRLIDALDLLALLAFGMSHSTDYAVFRSVRASCTTFGQPVRAPVRTR